MFSFSVSLMNGISKHSKIRKKLDDVYISNSQVLIDILPGQPLVFLPNFLGRSGSLNNLPTSLFQALFAKTVVDGTFVRVVQNLVKG